MKLAGTREAQSSAPRGANAAIAVHAPGYASGHDTLTATLPGAMSMQSAGVYALELILVAAIYFGLAESALWFPWINPAATSLWPPTGLALALGLVRGYRIWPAVLAGSFSSTAMVVDSLIESGCIAGGTVLATLAGIWLIGRAANGRGPFATPLAVTKFALAAFVPVALISTTLTVAGIALTESLGGAGTDTTLAETLGNWAIWWLADGTAILIVTPVIVLWATTPLRPLLKHGVWQSAAILTLAILIGFIAYSPIVGDVLGGGGLDEVLPYRSLLGILILLPLSWAALRGDRRDAATAALIFCGIAAWGFAAGGALVPQTDLNGSLSLLMALAAAVSVPWLILSAAIAVHQDAQARLLRKQGELSRQMEQTRLALDIAKRHFNLLIEGVVDHAIFVLDTTGHVASWNSTAQQIMGYSADEIIGKHFGIFYRPDERRAGEPNRALEFALKNGKHEVEGWRIRKNGTLFFVTGAVTAIHDDDGNLIGLASVIRDATERRDAQEKLFQAREQLAMAQKMEAIGKLTGGIAHDFNNLLMIIGGNAQAFKRLLDPKLPRAIEAIQSAAKRGESLTRQLLTFSRRQHLTPTVVDLSASIRNMRPMIESSLRGNIVYNEEIRPDVWPVEIDLAELELAIVNIAVNARDAMPSGGSFYLTVGNVTATRDLPGDGHNREFVAIEFSDSGVGIPPNLLSKIFDPFFTTKEVGKGTGLGLSQVYGFVHQAGGRINVESKVGQGTTITLYLPSCRGREIAGKEIAGADTPQLQRPTVLIVDDSAEVAEVTSSLFESLGYQTDYRDSAEAALRLLADGGKFDLVFSDIVMPGTIDGVGLAREIRTRYPHLPVVLTTGYSDAAQAAPADLRILRKPFDTAALRNFIQDMVGVSLVP